MKTIKLVDTYVRNNIKHAIIKLSIMPSAFPTLYLSLQLLISLLNTILQETLDNRARTYAVLNYQGMDENRIPIIRQRDCTSTVPCLAVNQVFG